MRTAVQLCAAGSNGAISGANTASTTKIDDHGQADHRALAALEAAQRAAHRAFDRLVGAARDQRAIVGDVGHHALSRGLTST